MERGYERRRRETETERRKDIQRSIDYRGAAKACVSGKLKHSLILSDASHKLIVHCLVFGNDRIGIYEFIHVGVRRFLTSLLQFKREAVVKNLTRSIN